MEQFTVSVDNRAFVYFVAAECIARGTAGKCRRLSARDMVERCQLKTGAGRHDDDGEPALTGRSGRHPFRLNLHVDRLQHRRNRHVHPRTDIGHVHYHTFVKYRS